MQWHQRNDHQSSLSAHDHEVGLTTRSAVTLATVRDWLVGCLADYAGLASHEIDIRNPCTVYGIDSIAGVALVGDLEMWLNVRLPPTLLWQHASIAAVCQYVMTTVQHDLTGTARPHGLDALDAAGSALDQAQTASPLGQLERLSDAAVETLLHHLLAA
jgi:acyl carrier protein